MVRKISNLVLTALPLIAFSMAMSASAHARGGPTVHCEMVYGPFTAVPPLECSSPVGICTHGTLVGNFPSTYDFVVDTLVPGNQPNLFLYTGHSLLTPADRSGVIHGNDSGYMLMRPDGTANFVTTVSLASGNQAFANVSGAIVAGGTMSMLTGYTSGSYGGLVCR